MSYNPSNGPFFSYNLDIWPRFSLSPSTACQTRHHMLRCACVTLLLLLIAAGAAGAPSSRHFVFFRASVLILLSAPVVQSQLAALTTGDRFVQKLRDAGSSIFMWSPKDKVPASWAAYHPTAAPFNLSDGSLIYSESATYCSILYLSGQACGDGARALVVEQGTLIGHSSRCLAAGLAVAEKARNTSISYHAFDFFSSFPATAMRRANFPESNMLWQLYRQGKTKPSYLQSIWHAQMVDPVFVGAMGHPGDIGQSTPKLLRSHGLNELPLEIWSIDSAKSHTQFITQAAAVWPRLRAGSIIHLMDCFKHQLFFFFEKFVMPGDVECVFGSLTSSPWSFVVRRAPLDWGKVVSHAGGEKSCASKPAVVEYIQRTIDRLGKMYGAHQAEIDARKALLAQKCSLKG